MSQNLSRFIAFLGEVQKCSKKRTFPANSTIVYVDADCESRDLMRRYAEELGLAYRLVVLEDGIEVIDHFISLLNSVETSIDDSEKKQIVCLLIMDINLPNLSGNEVLVQIKKLFEGRRHLLRPLVCYLSKTAEAVMNQFLLPEEQADIYLEKPLESSELTALIKIIDSR